jgi:nicotinate-nucleotide pyrophosphorylase (carboxylating)
VRLDALVQAALDEDIGPGDLTTEATVPLGAPRLATVIAKQGLVVSGQAAAAEVFRQVALRYGGTAVYTPLAPDGTRVQAGDVVARVEAPQRVVLIGERVALNLLMKLSGIATHTAEVVRAAEGSELRVVDTRKTTPLFRTLEKAAVRHGGGFGHRMGLYDGVMVKDNHIAAVGGIGAAVERVRAAVHHLVRVEVEVTYPQELDEALAAGADVILLDNMNDAQLQASVARARAVRPTVVIEASGNMNAERIARIKHFGLDCVSVGGLIHQARWVDLSLRFDG